MKLRVGLFAACAALLAGCGGGADTRSGQVSGIVFDEDGVPVRNAHVFFDADNRKDVQTNSNGVYALTDIDAGAQILRAEITANGARYFGSNVALVQPGQTTQNVNIAVYRDDRLGSIEGYVFDRQGFALQGAKVFVKQDATNTVLSSSYGISDDQGHYVVGALRQGMQYVVQVNGLNFNSDSDTFTLINSSPRRMDFTLPDAEDITLPHPTNVVVTAWTSPPVTREAREQSAIQNIKRIIKPGYKSMATSRDTVNGNIIEIDSTWDPMFDNALLGFGIYRATGTGPYRDVDFLRDPQSELYADMDTTLRVGQQYSYKITTISTGDRESGFSASASAVPLGEMNLRPVTGGSHPTFSWQSAQGANGYIVYLFDRYPSIGVSQFWDNEANPATGTSLAYPGAALSTGSYYFLIVGISTDGNYTISPVGQFNVG